MEVSQSTIKNFQETIPTPEVVAPVTEAPVIVDNTPPIIAPAAAPIETAATPEIPVVTVPIENEVIAFDFPEHIEVAPTEITPAIAASVTSWKDAIKDVPEDELAEMLGDDDFIKGMRKHIKNGGAPYDYISAKGINWDNVTDTDIIKADLRSEFPNATPIQIDRLFNKKYSQTETAEDEDKEDGLLLMSADARKSRQQKVETSKSFKIADARPAPQPQIQQPQIDEKAKEKADKDAAFIVNHEATKNLFQSKRVAIEISEGVKQNMGIKNPQALMDIWFKNGELAKYTTTPQGEPDVQLLQEAALFIANRSQFKKQIFNAGKEAGQKSLVDEGKNAGIPASVLPFNSPQTSIGEAFNSGIRVVPLKQAASV